MKFCVIGLGRFGYQLAISLAENGMDVLAIDSNESIIASIRDKVTQAICMRVTDDESLRSVGVDDMDTVIVAMGENFSQSILITALLKKRLQSKKVIARSISSIHKDILTLIGADEVILPEQEIGIRLADQLSSPFVEIIRLSDTFAVSQITAPATFIGKTISDLGLFKDYRVTCIGVKQDGDIVPVGSEYTVQKDDVLICSGNEDDLEIIAKL